MQAGEGDVVEEAAPRGADRRVVISVSSSIRRASTHCRTTESEPCTAMVRPSCSFRRRRASSRSPSIGCEFSQVSCSGVRVRLASCFEVPLMNSAKPASSPSVIMGQ